MFRSFLIVAAFAAGAFLFIPSADAGDVKFSLRIGAGYGYGYGHGHHRGHYGYYGRYRNGRHHRYRSPSYGYCYPSISYSHHSYPSSTVYYGTSHGYSTVYAPPATYTPRVIYGNTYPTHQTQTVEYVQPSTTSVPQPTVYAAPVVTRRDGWQLLGAQDYSKALVAFAAQTNDNNKAGAPKIGYALASAGLGQLDQAVWAMRRAMRVDPDASRDMLIDDTLRESINALIDKYVYSPDLGVSKSDTTFMAASMHWLLGETDQAHAQITRAIDAGDGSEAATNLQRMIDQAHNNEKE